ncbi:MAG TPA: hypothetical protein VEQ85_04855, partial [Lacipirellulaceae bacterium]|nr:hypothetical protein [Lacipirellulaceae bacterium]
LRYEYPHLELAVDCGSGTYIRSLGRDLATALGTSAVMASLARTAIGSFKLADAIPYDQLADQWHARLQPPDSLLCGLPAIRLSAAELRELQHGRFITRAAGIAPGEMAAYDPQGKLAAIIRQRTPGTLGAVRNFTQPA